MANVTQKISTYVYGISQQPDHLKRPGQVKELVNAFPDITFGCQKRPGTELISKLDTIQGGKWFSIFRDKNEKYLVQYIDGQLRIWSALDGTPRVVKYQSTPYVPPSTDPGKPDVPVVVPPALPNQCNPTLMHDKLTVWLAQRKVAEAKYDEYMAASKLVLDYKANKRIEIYTGPNCGVRTYPSNAIINYGSATTCGGGRLPRYTVYGYTIVTGVYTDSDIATAQGTPPDATTKVGVWLPLNFYIIIE
jgi:hypothetical protein